MTITCDSNIYGEDILIKLNSKQLAVGFNKSLK